MSLALTPINEAWNTVKSKPKMKQKQQQKIKPNIYNNPETQSKILSELGMIPSANENNYEDQEVEESKQIVEIHDSNSLNINLKNSELVNLLKPYSNEYIESILLKYINGSQQNDLTKELVDTIETMYLMISLILLLLVIDLLFKMKKN